MNALKIMMTALAPAALLALSSCSSTSSTQAKAAAQPPAAAPQTQVSAPQTPTPATEGSRAGIVINAVTATATVDSVDTAERKVVLRREDGSLTTYVCGPDVRNFDQIAVGDKVSVTLAEELAIALVKGGLPTAAGQSTAVVRAPLGEKPGGKIVETVGYTAKVADIDLAQRMVTLQMPDGKNRKVKVGPDIKLDDVKAGDDVGVRLTQAMIITVGKP